MRSNILDDRDWRKLVRTVEQGKCILLLGADIASDTSQQEPMPLTMVLAQRLASDMNKQPPGCDPNDLAHIAQVYLTQRDRDRRDLEASTQILGACTIPPETSGSGCRIVTTRRMHGPLSTI